VAGFDKHPPWQHVKNLISAHIQGLEAAARLDDWRRLLFAEGMMTAASTLPSVNQTICDVHEIHYSLREASCDLCGRLVSRFNLAERTAIDLNLDHPILLHVVVSVHYCAACHHYFRAQPPFLRANAIYANRVVTKAVQSVYHDSIAVRRAAVRLARDFWVQPSEAMIRHWCRIYSNAFDFEADYQPWVVSEFSGILCIDEVYQDKLALLLAVDPAAVEGDRLVGYQLVTGSITADDVEAFLTRLKAVGIDPAEVITDGSSLYPTVLSKVWPSAAHQLCLFHETRRVTGGVMKLINAVRRNLPNPPSASTHRGARPLHRQPLNGTPNSPAMRRWQQRQAERNNQIALVHHLAEQGLSQRAITRQTGFSRSTVKRWLKSRPFDLPMEAIPKTPAQPLQPVLSPRAVKQNKIRQVHELASQGLSYSAIARRVGAHRVTVKKWLQQPVPAEEEPILFLVPSAQPPPPPPAPWTSWEQVRQIREALQEHRFLLLQRPEHLNEEDQAKVAALLSSPIGTELQVGRSFLVDWYRIWRDETGQRRTLAEAQARYEAWQTDRTYKAVSALQQVQQRITAAKFNQLSQFLRQPNWEATNNGAERAGRAFRHRQAPHFNLRNKDTIAGSITVAACLRKEGVTMPTIQSPHTCQRGRKKQATPPISSSDGA
jgi:transposase